VRICVRKTFQNMLKQVKMRKNATNGNPLFKRGFNVYKEF